MSGVGLGAYFFPYPDTGAANRVFDAYLSAYARVAGAVLHVLDGRVTVVANAIYGPFSMRIVRSCDAMEANILFLAATLAFPGPWRRKAAALVVGLLALVACNIGRLCCLYYVGMYLPARFDFAHYEAWPLVMVGFAVVDFLICVRWISKEAPPGAGTAVVSEADVAG